jgi:hypothetical protein
VGPPPNQYCGFWDGQSEDSTVKQISPEIRVCIRIYIPVIVFFLYKIKSKSESKK